MRMRMIRLVVCMTLAAPGMAGAQQGEGDAVLVLERREALEHARIDAERARIEAATARAEADCYQRFAVSDCLRRVRGERRDVLSDLRRQEVALNDAARMCRVADQSLRIDERVREAATR